MLFGPETVSTDDITLVTAALAWWQALLLLLSHAPAIPVIRLLWRLGLYLFASVVLFGMLASLAYHACLDWGFMCFSLPLDVSRMDDYIWASYLLVAEELLVLRIYSHEWASIISLGSLAIVIFAALAAPFSFVVQLFVLLLGFLALFIKAVLIDAVLYPLPQVATAFDAVYRFAGEPLGLGLALQAVALGVYFIDGPRWYWLAHSTWHFLGYTGLYFVVLGVTRDLVNWPGWRSDKGHAIAQKRDEGAPEHSPVFGDQSTSAFESVRARSSPGHLVFGDGAPTASV